TGNGMYTCAACGNELFSSTAKFNSESGWPSFYDVATKGNVKLQEDRSLGMVRTEVVCARCGGHLGHLFHDGPKTTPDGKECTGLRYCINSLALDFKEKK
ncbi:MAG: peptide-methionine (R)-S-oxide reductase MsrB, partial [Candidatus Roizmanbacteria bacterium]|nr:peptide-methionine (R)-S-oxide reductase MsrB [Candidatus Roizmanbacteria bacterium]